MSVAGMQSSSTAFLLRRSRSLLSQESLEICTENLGSETGSEDFSSFMDDLDCCGPLHGLDDEKEEETKDSEEKHFAVPEDGADANGMRRHQAKELKSVSYHCSIGRRPPLKRSPRRFRRSLTQWAVPPNAASPPRRAPRRRGRPRSLSELPSRPARGRPPPALLHRCHVR
ncbi:unnamed protein product [Musa textilis]